MMEMRCRPSPTAPDEPMQVILLSERTIRPGGYNSNMDWALAVREVEGAEKRIRIGFESLFCCRATNLGHCGMRFTGANSP